MISGVFDYDFAKVEYARALYGIMFKIQNRKVFLC